MMIREGAERYRRPPKMLGAIVIFGGFNKEDRTEMEASQQTKGGKMPVVNMGASVLRFLSSVFLFVCFFPQAQVEAIF